MSMLLNHFFGPSVEALIQSLYDGGIKKFTQEGGSISVSRGETKPEIIIYHPGLPEDLTKSLTDRFIEMADVTFVTKPNFEGMEMEDAQRGLGEILSMIHEKAPFEMAASVSRSAINLTAAIPEEMNPQAICEGILEALKGLPGAIHIRIACNGKFYKHDDDSDAPKSEAPVRVQIESVERDTVISDDDVTNLQIALGQHEDSGEFLRALGLEID